METILFSSIALAVGIGLGFVIGRHWFSRWVGEMEKSARKRAQQIIREAEAQGELLKKEKIREAKEVIQEERNELERKYLQQEAKLKEREAELKLREKQLLQKAEDLKKHKEAIKQREADLQAMAENLKVKMDEVERLKSEQIRQLEAIASLTAEEARERLVEQLKGEAEAFAMAQAKELIDRVRNSAMKEAKKIIVQTIQRIAAEEAIEHSVTVFPLESDDLKGRIIGREGRNIRALEAATECSIIVDDTPEAIVISGFDPYRREIARLALRRLVADGRIHPTRIEEAVAKARQELEAEIREIGERTIIELGIRGMHPELVRLVGKMKYRFSYGQNLLQHSREVANLCATMAAELGLNVQYAKRAGLLHDIGKVAEEFTDLPHALAGMKLAEKYKEAPEVCNAIGAHHDEIEMTTLIAPIVQACDAISGARPGARREIYESYIQRIHQLEQIALSYAGVSKAYAIQAGRELRVIVESDKVKDDDVNTLAWEIAKRIQNEMQYPGQILVTVIREHRIQAIAE